MANAPSPLLPTGSLPKMIFMVDIIALVLVALLASLGWKRGTVLTALSAGSLLFGYAGALILYRPVGRLISVFFSVPPIIALPLGGMSAMIGITLTVRIVAAWIRRRRNRREEDGWAPSLLDRAGGSVLGAVWGLGIVVFLAWAGVVLHGLTGRGPDMENTASGQLASAVVGTAVYALADRFTGDGVLASTMALAAVKPGEAAQSLSQLTGDRRFRALFEDQALRSAIMRSDFAAVTRHAEVLELARDPAFLQAAAKMRLVGDLDPNVAPTVVTQQLVERIAPMVRTAEALSQDQDVQRILQNPQVLELLQGGDLGSLAANADFNKLAQKLVESLRASQISELGR